MPVTLTFHKVSEKKPEHGQRVVYLKPIGSSFAYGYDFRSTNVEYCWFSVDEDGFHDGMQISYDPKDTETPDQCVLEIMFDGWTNCDDWLWMDEAEYWAELEKGM